MTKIRILLETMCVASAVMVAAICGDLWTVDAATMQVAMPVAAFLMGLPYLIRLIEAYMHWVFSPVPPSLLHS